MRILLGFLALLLSPLAMLPAHAQEDAAPVAEQSDPHARLVASVQDNADMDAIMAIVLAETDRQFRMQPQFATLEVQSPGTIAAVVEAMAPNLRQYQDRVRKKYLPEYIAISREIFTDGEARQLADFYSSELGRKLMQSISQNFSVSNTLEGAANTDEEFEVSADEIARDNQVTVARAIGGMSAEDLAAIEEALAGVQAIDRMQEFQQRTLQVQLKIENEPPTPKEEQQLEQAITKVFAKRFPQ